MRTKTRACHQVHEHEHEHEEELEQGGLRGPLVVTDVCGVQVCGWVELGVRAGRSENSRCARWECQGGWSLLCAYQSTQPALLIRACCFTKLHFEVRWDVPGALCCSEIQHRIPESETTKSTYRQRVFPKKNEFSFIYFY